MTKRPPSALVHHAMDIERAYLRQDRTARAFLRDLGELVPDGSIDLSQVRLVLDVGCGVGTWARLLAQHHRHLHVVGLDRDLAALDMARFLAEEQGITNVHFVQQDAQDLVCSLAPRERFDLIHLAFLAEALLTLDYSMLLRDLLTFLRPGGVLLWTEMEFPLTTSPACERLFALTCTALQRAGQSFVPAEMQAYLNAVNQYLRRSGCKELSEVRRHLGLTPQMSHWLRQVGYQHIQQTPAAVDVSAQQPMHPHFVAEMLAFGERIQPFLMQQEVIIAEDSPRLLTQLREDLRDASFCGLAFLLTVSAQAPQEGRE